MKTVGGQILLGELVQSQLCRYGEAFAFRGARR
jgi:hypothetical protein